MNSCEKTSLLESPTPAFVESQFADIHWLTRSTIGIDDRRGTGFLSVLFVIFLFLDVQVSGPNIVCILASRKFGLDRQIGIRDDSQFL